MPETRWERIAAVAMLCAIVVIWTLIFLTDREALGRESIPASSAPPLAAPSKVVSPVARVAGARLLAVPTAQRAAASPDTQRVKARLTLTASNGASWVTVRAVSAQGRILYTGTLLEGRSVTATGKQLWVRFGAGAHPTVRLNGRPLQLDPRTSSALIVRRGMQQLQG